MKYYTNTVTNAIFDERALRAARIVCGDMIDDRIVELETEPDVVTLVKRSTFSTAIHRYMEINDCDYDTAQAGVRKIVGLMKNLNKGDCAK